MSGHTFRVFVSSTFSDLKAERNALAQWVFPRLRLLCESRGYKFQAVDLRWGVRDEAAADQQTVRICLDEIARCQRLSPRPNFIVLLGDRYGWCPPPSVIPADEMDALYPHLAGDALSLVFGAPVATDDAGSVREHGWYQRDDNAVPPEYVLQPRRGAFEKYETWEPVERRLRNALAAAAERAGLGEGAQRKYGASATELEIMKGAVDAADAKNSVFAFFRSIANLDDVKAALPGEAAKEAIDTLPDGTWDKHAWNAQRRLKELLRDQIGDGNVWPYGAKWTNGALDLACAIADLPSSATPPLTDAALRDMTSLREAWQRRSRLIAAEADAALSDTTSFCEAVWQRLSRVIVAEMDVLDAAGSDPLAAEQRAHADFARERRRVFVGRHEPLRRIAAYLKAGPARALVVHGPSGSGKSALMARAIADARAVHPGAHVIERFIGATPGASEIRSLLEGICQDISRAFGADQNAIGDYPKLVAELPKRLALPTPDRPLIVFLDALDQLGETDEGRRLVWLPRMLPANVRIVVSTLEDEEGQCFRELRAGADDDDLVPVEPLTKNEGREILSEWLKGSPEEEWRERGRRELSNRMSGGPRRISRTLTTARTGEPGRPGVRGQLDLVLAKFETEGSPLYLKLAFEEARRWRSYDDDTPAAALPEDVAGMIRALYRRLSDPSQHGAVVTGRALAYLAAARYGLADEEMLNLLWRDPDVKAELQEHARKHHRLPEGTDALPPVIWSRLFADLEPYLAEREVFGVRVIAFFHSRFADVVGELWPMTWDEIAVTIGSYFGRVAALAGSLTAESGRAASPDPRREDYRLYLGWIEGRRALVARAIALSRVWSRQRASTACARFMVGVLSAIDLGLGEQQATLDALRHFIEGQGDEGGLERVRKSLEDDLLSATETVRARGALAHFQRGGLGGAARTTGHFDDLRAEGLMALDSALRLEPVSMVEHLRSGVRHRALYDCDGDPIGQVAFALEEAGNALSEIPHYLQSTLDQADEWPR